MLNGLLIAIAASVVHASADALKKALAQRKSALPAVTAFISAGAVLAACYWVLGGCGGLPRPGFWFYGGLSLVINLLAQILFFQAVRVSPLSLTLPFLAFSPAFLVGTSYLINQEAPKASGAIGVGLILIGAFLLNLKQAKRGLVGPFIAIARERGSLLMTAVAALWSISAAADKAAVLQSSPAFHLMSLHVGLSAILMVLCVVKGELRAAAALPLPTLGASALHIVGCGLQFTALPMLNAAYVIAIKRAGMVLGILYGRIFFGERDLAERLLGASVMIAGVILIAWER
jgi:drug/metabolite transporter (DMT)-like permease